jgi:hypothetical protein
MACFRDSVTLSLRANGTILNFILNKVCGGMLIGLIYQARCQRLSTVKEAIQFLVQYSGGEVIFN